MPPLLDVRDISVHFGGLAALKEVSFGIESGERLALIGPNGAGKTTLFNILTGQLKPSSGSVHFKDRDITRAKVFERTHMGMARSFQTTSLFPYQTVRVNTLIALQGIRKGRYNLWRGIMGDRQLQKEARVLLEKSELWDLRDTVVSSLAYGQQRKLEIVLSLASSPELLLLDEPSCGLTTAESADITARIKVLGAKITVLMIAHDMDLVFGVAERVMLLHYGQIMCEGTCEEIRSNQMVRDIYMGSRTPFGAGRPQSR
jgi:branched-chain amino acid transport system ATP-binding protein